MYCHRWWQINIIIQYLYRLNWVNYYMVLFVIPIQRVCIRMYSLSFFYIFINSPAVWCFSELLNIEMIKREHVNKKWNSSLKPLHSSHTLHICFTIIYHFITLSNTAWLTLRKKTTWIKTDSKHLSYDAYQDIYPRLGQCRPNVCDVYPALVQPWVNVSCLLGSPCNCWYLFWSPAV